MLRRAALVMILTWLSCPLVVWAQTAATEPAEKPQRNVVIIVADDLGLQMGCYGNRVVKTPHIDQLAREGTRFTRAHCTTASCSASRSVILSGLYNHATGHYGHEHGSGHFSTYDWVRTLPNRLNDAGYRTCSIGKYHVAPESVYHFSEYANEGVEGNRNGVRMAANAKSFIEQDPSKPFFIYFCSSDPHRGGDESGFSNRHEYVGCTSVVYDPAAMNIPPWLPDNADTRKEFAEYYQAISRFDEGVGALMQALRDTGRLNDTLVMLLSDNGPPFPGAKTTQYEPGINLPLIVRSPDQRRRGIANDALVTWVDLVPTALEFTGVAGPAKPTQPVKGRKRAAALKDTLHGRSFLGILDEEHPPGWDLMFASHTFHEVQMYYPMRTAIQGNFKYIYNIANPLPYPFASDLYASPTWQGVLQRGDTMYGKRTVEAYIHRPRDELYDLSTDPNETRNLASDPNYAEILAEMQKRVQKWQQDTNDPWFTKWTYE